MEKKIKIVFISRSELNQRAIAFNCLDELSKDFDLEYWDCSDFLYLPQHFERKIERPYLRKIHSFKEFVQNLSRIPSDAIVSPGLNFCKKNRKVLKTISKRFPIVVHVSFYSNTPYSSGVKKDIPTTSSARNRPLSVIKKRLYNSSTIRTFIKILFHPHRYRTLINLWQWQKEADRFEKIVWFNCAKNIDYYINHPDVEQYVRLKQSPQKRTDRYIVYIDQYIPYHVDLKFHMPDLNQRQVAEELFPSLNRYFCFLEKQYDCKVIIAAHPVSNYRDNPFEGREICLFQTAALVRDSVGVCMHSSNALSFVMLFDKPVVSMISNAIRQMPRLNNQILNISNEWHIPLVDIDSAIYDKWPLQKLNADVRQAYINKYFGDFETEGLRSNVELLKEHYISLFNSIHQECADKNTSKKHGFYQSNKEKTVSLQRIIKS